MIVAPDPDSIRNSIDNYGADIQKLITSKINTNDTWARDHAFITLLKEDATPLLLDFCFNGWGMKFAANYDNQINNELYFHHPVLKGEYVFCRNFILEGGSIESDGKGSLLTTEQCLLAKNRNEMNRQEVEDFCYRSATISIDQMVKSHWGKYNTYLSTPLRLPEALQNLNLVSAILCLFHVLYSFRFLLFL